MAPQGAPAPSAIPDDSWAAIRRQALALAAALETIAPAQPPQTQEACVTYASLVAEIAGDTRRSAAAVSASCAAPANKPCVQ